MKKTTNVCYCKCEYKKPMVIIPELCAYCFHVLPKEKTNEHTNKRTKK